MSLKLVVMGYGCYPNNMRYYSIKDKNIKVSFKEAILGGISPDRGLYYPEKIPVLDNSFIGNIGNLSNEEIAYECISKFTGSDIDEKSLKEIVSETIDFEFPLNKLSEKISVLELFHGPTMAFKDVGARFTSRVLSYFNSSEKKKVTVLVATSGDTGAAAASGFHDVKGVDVFILFPKGRISAVQEKQITTLSDNIYPVEVDGSFDDCQEMVKDALTDKDLITKINFTSANSINISRWIPQTLYYFFAYKQIEKKKEDLIFSIPSGNFGNLFACLVSSGMGLPVKRIIASNNLNDTFTKFINSNKYKPSKSIRTISSAMDVGDPSNFVRVLEYFSNQGRGMKEFISAYSISDKETILGMKELEERYDYVCDPHGSVGYMGIKKHKELYDNFNYIFLETAHYSKFMEEMENVVPSSLSYPERIKKILSEDGNSYKIRKYSELKDYINLTNS